MRNQEIKDAIRVLSRERDIVQQAIDKCAEGTGYVSPDGMINAADYVTACSTAITILNEHLVKEG